MSEQMLSALGIMSCHDLYVKRGILLHLYSTTSFHHFMQICAGIGSTRVERSQPFCHIAKSIECVRQTENVLIDHRTVPLFIFIDTIFILHFLSYSSLTPKSLYLILRLTLI